MKLRFRHKDSDATPIKIKVSRQKVKFYKRLFYISAGFNLAAAIYISWMLKWI